ncbi:glycoside hydrolase family 1 protein [Actinocorallia sp. A-T 12471]|uniref:glycoside hydrolase family 1 protein n=1 Tax=Actinocorallia sp. A-T 12471 TaxID=3089813 RepID=UPI0029CB0D80|nr:family 1 glycosylhydrolase [Actinocorallia sp. A-T 12471]MDX6738165.1 family 1 glycosylhydrolase [Actinocorallia sp. A-T 12471]
MLGSLFLGVPAHAESAVPRFPADFLWGVSSSGFQSEGSFPDSNWTRYAAKKEPYRDSVDFRNRYPEDVERAAGLGVGVFRTSIEWARVEPKKGTWDWKEVAYYDDLVAQIRARGMRPMLTLNHWVHPGWVQDRGGWRNAATADDWLRFVAFVVDRYKNMDVVWITFNEASQYIFHELTDGGMSVFDVPKMRDNLVRAHRAAYDLIHAADPGAMVSTNIAYGNVLNPLFDQAIFTKVTDKLDFIGVDYYYGASVFNLSAVNALTGAYWKIKAEPEGLYYVLREYQRRLPHLPVFVVEAGMPTDDGKPRADGYTRTDHLRDHLYWVQRAIGDGVKMMGFNYWSLTDNYEWGSYRPRFGLYTVDVASDPSLKRVPTDAVASYRRVIAERGVPSGYRPVIPPAWCSWEGALPSCLQTLPTPPA